MAPLRAQLARRDDKDAPLYASFRGARAARNTAEAAARICCAGVRKKCS